MVEWLVQLGYGAASQGFESSLGFSSGWKTLSVNPAVNGYLIFFKSGKDKAAKGEGWALTFIFCAQDTVV